MHLYFQIKLATAAYVFRDHVGIQADGKSLQPSSVLVAELVTAWMGVRVAVKQLHATHIWLEGDSAVVVQWLSHPPSNNQQLHNLLLRNLWSWKTHTTYFLISHASREVNHVSETTWLAAKAHAGVFVFHS